MKKELNKLSIPVNRDAANAAHDCRFERGQRLDGDGVQIARLNQVSRLRLFARRPGMNRRTCLLTGGNYLTSCSSIYRCLAVVWKSVIAEERAIPNFRMRFCTGD